MTNLALFNDFQHWNVDINDYMLILCKVYPLENRIFKEPPIKDDPQSDCNVSVDQKKLLILICEDLQIACL